MGQLPQLGFSPAASVVGSRDVRGDGDDIMKKTNRIRAIMKPRSRLQRAMRVAGLALVLLPEPVTTPIGVTMVGLSFVVPPEHRRALVHCGASIRRGHLDNYGRSCA